MSAAYRGCPEVAELLLRRGADKSKRDKDGDVLQNARKGNGSAEAKAALERLLA